MPSSGEFLFLLSGVAEIPIFVVLRVLLQFFISHVVAMVYMGPTLAEQVNSSSHNTHQPVSLLYGWC
jgi:hypothetical protein